MANPNIKQLISRALELGIKDEAAARKLLKARKIATFGKLEKVLARRRGAQAEGGEPRSIDKDTAQQVIRTTGVKLLKAKGGRKYALNMPGPRGFRLGPTWLKSIAEARGPALKPSNLPKLLATARVKGVDIPKTATLTQKDVVQLVARAMN